MQLPAETNPRHWRPRSRARPPQATPATAVGILNVAPADGLDRPAIALTFSP
jgi:hypothetical protein